MEVEVTRKLVGAAACNAGLLSVSVGIGLLFGPGPFMVTFGIHLFVYGWAEQKEAIES